MRFRFLLLTTFLVPYISVHALGTSLDPSAAVSTLNLLISQYETRIKQLENENTILRNEMMKAGIKIPLSEYSGAVISTETPTTNVPPIVSTLGTGSTSTGSLTTSSGSTGTTTSVDTTGLAAQYGKDVAGFVARVNTDWKSIRDYYKLNPNARIAGYEFVQSGSNDFTFVDIVVGSGAPAGVYDVKILYQFEKTEYKRKLVGIFEYNPTTGKYVTRPGGFNPFAGVARTFIKDPFFAGPVSTPSTVSATGSTSNTGSTAQPTPTSSNPAEVADILKAYSEKKYLSTISLSNTYLEKNAPTVEILNIRYRTYFIIGKFSESLAELAKMEKLGGLDRQTACNAQVIATYSKNQNLIDKYTAICKK